MNSTLWQAEQLRAGQVYSKIFFTTKDEAERFLREARKAEPDGFWRVEEILAKQVWN